MTREKPKTGYGPVYAAALYPEMATLARKHGYAMAVHGSLARDFDLICVPWVKTPSTPAEVVSAITNSFVIKQIGEPEAKEHGRIAYTLSVGFGECACDLSFMPVAALAPAPAADDVALVDALETAAVLGDDRMTPRTALLARLRQPDDVIEECARKAAEYATIPNGSVSVDPAQAHRDAAHEIASGIRALKGK